MCWANMGRVHNRDYLLSMRNDTPSLTKPRGRLRKAVKVRDESIKNL